MIKMSAFAVAAALCVSASPAFAQDGLGLEAGVAELRETTGAELGVGYRFALGPVRLTPTLGGFIYQADNDRYYRDSSVDRCRDRTNGQFARDERCNDAAVEAYGRLEATLRYRSVEFGAGYRLDEEDGNPYGTLSFDVSPRVAVKLNGGSDYLGLGLVLR